MQNPKKWEYLPQEEKDKIIERVKNINTTLLEIKDFDIPELEKFWNLIFKLAKNWQPKDQEAKKKSDEAFKTFFETIS